MGLGLCVACGKYPAKINQSTPPPPASPARAYPRRSQRREKARTHDERTIPAIDMLANHV